MPTVPQEFHFNSSRRSEVHNPSSTSEFVPLTNAVEKSLKSFRSSEADTSSKPFVPTKPIGFHSHVEDRLSSSRPKEYDHFIYTCLLRQLTTEERIASEAALFQFKARPIAHNLFSQSETVAPLPKHQPTVPKSPKLSTTERLGKLAIVEEEVKEVKKTSTGPVQPFNLSTDQRGSQKEQALVSRLKAIEAEVLNYFFY